MKRVLTFCGVLFLMIGIVFCAVAALFFHQGGVDWHLTLMFGGFGVLFGGLGAWMAWLPIHRDRVVARLLDHGTLTTARIEDVTQDRRFSMNGRHPWVIRCSWTDPDGRIRYCNSENTWYDPTPYLEGRETLPLYYDPDHPRRCAVDTAGVLPEEH